MAKILIIDDKLDNLITITAILKSFLPDCNVITAQSGCEGLEKARTQFPDTILLDIKMPGMDGFEVCRQLKSEPLTCHIPVVFLTAINTDRESKIKGFELGADAFITKPLDDLELIARVKSMLKIRKSYEEVEKQVLLRTLELEETNKKLKAEIEERKEADKRQLLSLNILQYLNQADNKLEVIEVILKLIKTFTNIEAVGIRLKEGEDFPYYLYNGFSEDFIKMENYICSRDREGKIIKDAHGNPYLECMCGNILLGKTIPLLPFFTEGGSFWTNNIKKFLTTKSKNERMTLTRNRCIIEGYESLALIPLRFHDEIIGLLQLNDHRADCFTLEIIRFLEKISESIGIVLAKKQMEEALKLSDEMLGLAQRSAGAGVWDWDMVTGYLNWSKEFFNLFGLDPDKDEATFDTWNKVVHPDDLKRASERIEKSIKDNTPLFNDYRIVLPDGQIKWINALGNTIYDQEGQSVRMTGICIDITERKKIEKDLVKSEKKYRQFIELAEEGVWGIDARGNTTFVNPKMARMFGYTVDEMIDRHLFSFMDEKEVDLCKNYLERRSQGIKEQHDFIFLRKDGQKIYTNVSTSDIKDDNGNYTGAIGLVTDITERMEAEIRLRESEEKFSKVFRDAPVWIAITDMADATYQDVNEEVLRASGFTRDEVIGHTAAEIGWIKTEDRVRMINELQKHGRIDNLEMVFRGKDGRTLYGSFNGEQILIGNRPCLLTVTIDITERKRAEEEQKKLQNQLLQAQKMESIGTLASGIAHDFNNILGAIMGYTELSLDLVSEDDLLKSNLYQVMESSNRAKELVRQILTFSRKVEQKAKPVIINSIIKEAVSLLRASLPTTIDIKYISENSSIILADPTQIHQIIMNLGANSLHAMKEHGGILEIYQENILLEKEEINLYSGLKPGSYVRLLVRDTGQGIPPEYIEKIFEPYFTTKEFGEGTGLGLSVVHGIVKSYGGNIKVYSEQGKGTKFEILFPRIKTEVNFTIAKNSLPPPGGKERILIVDDEESLVEISEKILTILGYKVTARQSSIDALHTFRKDPDNFDIVISDLTMPKMTGLSLAEELHRIKPDLPVILCTGNDDNISTFEGSGISDYIKKPFTRDTLARTVRRVLDKRLKAEEK